MQAYELQGQLHMQGCGLEGHLLMQGYEASKVDSCKPRAQIVSDFRVTSPIRNCLPPRTAVEP